jgi:hypothetical protein
MEAATAMARDAIVQALREGRATLGRALKGVDGDAEHRRPANGGWTIAECVEHVAVSERYLLGRLRAAQPAERSLDNRVREAAILARGMDRTRPVVCPADGLPTGRFGSARSALEDFDATRTETEAFVERFDGDPRNWVTDHPVIPGPVNVVEILLTMAVHPARHAKQIEEVRSELSSGDRV